MLVLLVFFLGLADILILLIKLLGKWLIFIGYYYIINLKLWNQVRTFIIVGLDTQAVDNFLKLARGAQTKEDYLSRVREFDRK